MANAWVQCSSCHTMQSPHGLAYCASCGAPGFFTADRASSSGVSPTADQRADDEIRQLWARHNVHLDIINELRASLSAAREEGERAKQDSARFDWLEKCGFTIFPTFEAPDHWGIEDSTLSEVKMPSEIRIYGETLRDVIDKARAVSRVPASQETSE